MLQLLLWFPHFHHHNSTFTCFPRLPAELKLQVWSYVYLGQRVVEPRAQDRKSLCWKSNAIPRGKPSQIPVPAVECTRIPPVLLHVCQETRYGALKHDELVSTLMLMYCISVKHLCGDPVARIYSRQDWRLWDELSILQSIPRELIGCAIMDTMECWTTPLWQRHIEVYW